MNNEYTENNRLEFEYKAGWNDALESAAKLIEADLYPETNQYHVQYNAGIKNKANEIRKLKNG